MSKVSAGLLLYRQLSGGVEFLLAHPGGPLFARRDEGAWGIPKGLVEPGEDLFLAAKREFCEETGLPAPEGQYRSLGEVRQRSGKHVHGWAVRGDCDPAAIESNTFEMEWPPRSGRRQSFPEIDRAQWFALKAARRKILSAQLPFLERTIAGLEVQGAEAGDR